MAFAILLLFITQAFGFSTPARNGWVTDEAGILDADTAGAVARRLVDLERDTGYEVVVVTLKSLQDASIETWGNVLGESWRVGRAGGHDAGVLLIVAPNERKVRIAVGYGAGNRIPDSVAAAIVADHILPYFRRGEFSRGVKAGVDSIAVQLDRGQGAIALDVERSAYPVNLPQPGLWTRFKRALTPSHDTLVISFWVLVAICVLVWMVVNAGNVGSGRRYRNSGWDDDDDGAWFSWGGGSSSSGGGGGSSGGGGGSFGGGATGSW